MSGHSHWAGIKRKKEVVDARKGKLFSSLARNISTAARDGGAELDTNIKLRYAVDKARAASMPKDNIERAIKKGTGELAGASYEEIVYEAYGPGGVAILVEAITDNRNRTVAELRKILELKGGNLARANSVAWMFEKKGLFIIDRESVCEDDLMAVALAAGAEDMETVNNTYQLTSAPAEFDAVHKALSESKVPCDFAELSSIPKTNIAVDEPTGRKLVHLMDQLEEHDDVQNVYVNFELPQGLLAEMQE